MFISIVDVIILYSLSNGEDFITTEQLQRRMKDIASNSNDSYSRFNNVLHNNSQKDANDTSTDDFPKNGLPEDCIPKRDEDENGVYGKKTFGTCIISSLLKAIYLWD